MSRKSNSETEKINTSAWMMTFSDLVMLLLTFFVLLLTMSSMDQKKLKDVFTHFSGATGVLEFAGFGRVQDLATFIRQYQSSEGLLVVNQDNVQDVLMPEGESEQIREQIQTDMMQIVISDDSRGIVLSFQEDIIFDPGRAELKSIVYPILDKIAVVIKSTPNDILIMGHTDNVPLQSGAYASNWELSMYRGLSVLDYFVNQKKIRAERFMVGGYGASRPLPRKKARADSPANRRVEIIFKHI